VSTREPQAYLTERIREVLAHDPRVAELGIAVSVAGDQVLVTGNVATDERRQAVEEVVTPMLGDLVLRNGITVSSLREGDGEEVVS
jgi:osmotically-inducible protein OsmY